MGKHNFTDTMELGKLQAQIDRNKGRHVGKSAPGWDRKRYRLQAPLSPWRQLFALTRARWHTVAGQAMADYQWTVNPSRDDIEAFFENGGKL